MQQQQQYVGPPGSSPYQGQMFYTAPTVQVITAGTGPRVYPAYKDSQSMGLGITSVIIGILCIVFNGIIIGVNVTGIPYIGHGIWCGAMFVVSGSFGIAAAKNKTICLIVTFMVMSIVSGAFSATLLGLSIPGAIAATDWGWYSGDFEETVEMALESCMAVLAFVEGILIIWSSVICCKAICCCNSAGPTNSMVISTQQIPYNTAHYNGAPQMMYIAQPQQPGQYGTYQAVPMYNGYGQQVPGIQIVPPPAYMPSTNIGIPQPQNGYVTPPTNNNKSDGNSTGITNF